MHPLISAYLRWHPLYKLVTFGGRKDLEDEKNTSWRFYLELRDGDELKMQQQEELKYKWVSDDGKHWIKTQIGISDGWRYTCYDNTPPSKGGKILDREDLLFRHSFDDIVP